MRKDKKQAIKLRKQGNSYQQISKGAEGSKWKSVDFANADPQMVKLMLKFFKNICKVPPEKIKIQIIAHINIDIPKAISYWSNLTKIPKNQFTKTCCSANKNSPNKRKYSLTYGTIHIRINNVKLFFQIIGWIDSLKLYFITKIYDSIQ